MKDVWGKLEFLAVLLNPILVCVFISYLSLSVPLLFIFPECYHFLFPYEENITTYKCLLTYRLCSVNKTKNLTSK